MAIVPESWLASDDPEKWASAVMKCQTASPYCGADGECKIGGACFPHTRRVAINNQIRKLRQQITALECERDSLE